MGIDTDCQLPLPIARQAPPLSLEPPLVLNPCPTMREDELQPQLRTRQRFQPEEEVDALQSGPRKKPYVYPSVSCQAM